MREEKNREDLMDWLWDKDVLWVTPGFLTYKTVDSVALRCAENPERLQFEEEGQEFGLGYIVDVEHRYQVDSR